MEDAHQLHEQLDSLGQLRTIVKTMKALSAASIRQYEQAVSALDLYYRTVERGLYVVLKDLPPVRYRTGTAPDSQQVAAIVFGTDHGLCGRFNEALAQHAIDHMAGLSAPQSGRKLLAVGARIAASLENAGQAIEEDFMVPGSAEQITATVEQILLKVDEWREQGSVATVYLYYNRHTDGQAHQPLDWQLLPLDLNQLQSSQRDGWPSRSLPTYSMARESLIQRLIHQYLFVAIFRACAESQASEHASRLAAMQSAQRNLDERLDEVTMRYRRARQTLITSELLDVVAGFESVSGNA